MSYLRIKILEGSTVDGKTEYEFDADKTVVVFGRDPIHCDVVFEDELRSKGVGNEHVALRRSLGRFELDLNTENFVAVDGRPAFEGQEITDQAILELDRGVRISVEIVKDRPETIAQRKASAQPGHLAVRNRTLVLASLAFAAVLAGLVWFNSQKIWSIDADVSKRERVSETILEKTINATYMVLVKNAGGAEKAIGTAWVARSDGNPRVVTNAHVAEMRNRLEEGYEMYIRSSVAPDYLEHRVVAHQIHPGYERFRNLTSAYESSVETVQGGRERVHQIPAADVALLEVDDVGRLEEPLPLLPESELDSLRAGQELAYAGYPTENMVSGNLKRPTPVTHKDELIAVTDFFMVRHADGGNRMVQHALPSTGGASGSPIVDSRGRVVAVLSAGNVMEIQGGRLPLAVNVNFAQRIDFVHDLLEQRADQATERYSLRWQEGLASFDSLPEMALEEAFEGITDKLGTDLIPEPTKVRSELPSMTEDPNAEAARHDLGQIGNAVILVRVLPAVPADLDLALFAAERKVATDIASSQFALIEYPVRESQHLEVEVTAARRLNENSAVPYTLEVYQWPATEEVFDRSATNDAIAAVKQFLGTEEDPKLVFEESTRLSTGPIPPLDTPLVQREFVVPVDGVYLFMAYPLNGKDDIDLLIADSAGVIVGHDAEYRPEAYIDAELSIGRRMMMLAHGFRSDVPIELRVYQW